MPVLALGIIVGSWTGLEMRRRFESPSVLLARALGLLLRHGGMLLTAIILIELIFALPGLGRLLVDATYNSDAFLISTSAALFVWMALLSRLLGNLLLAWTDKISPAPVMIETAPESGRSLAVGGAVTIGLLVIMFLVAFAAPHDPFVANVRDRLVGPGGAYLLGTDHVGRDVLSRILVACRTAAIIALPVTLVSILVGVPLFILRISLDRARSYKAFYIVEGVLEGLLAVPWLIMGILVHAKLGAGLPFVALAAILVPRAIRVGWALGAQERLDGLNVARMILRQGALFLAAATVIGTALSLVGVGVPPPTPDFGAIISESRAYIAREPGLIVYPGIFLTAIVATWLIVAALLSRSGMQHRAVRWSHIMS